MTWLLCKILGHRWHTHAINWRKHRNLFHLCTMAGYKSECLRCGEVWDDLWSPWFGDEVIEFGPPNRALPKARVLRR